MRTHDITQGSQEWHAHRATHFNASECAAMLGIDPNKSRDELLLEKFLGMTADASEFTQKIFDKGHRFEELARTLAEEITGASIYPVTGSAGKLSASFDGITANDLIAWEHKQLNIELKARLVDGLIPDQYHPQIEQQLMISGAEKCLFMASKWDDSDVLIEEFHAWYSPNFDLRERIVAGWNQFEIDLQNCKYVKPEQQLKAELIMGLPTVFAHAEGRITKSNLPEFQRVAELYIQNINMDLQTDQHFVDAVAVVNFCAETEKKLDATKLAILAQTASIDDALRIIDNIKAQLSKKRLLLAALVRTEKEARKTSLILNVRNEYQTYLNEFEINFPQAIGKVDFGAATKNLKSLKSMQEALNAALANAKVNAVIYANDYLKKMAWYKDEADSFNFLFSDLQQIVVKECDDFKLIVTSRIDMHKKAEEEKAETLRQKIQADADKKAQAAEQERINVAAKAADALSEETEKVRADESARSNVRPVHVQAVPVKSVPDLISPDDLIDTLMDHYKTTREIVEQSIRNAARALDDELQNKMEFR
jgi:putative phage-type endonuclease